ncbi:MAG: alpha-amylase family glycosyl hydrolase [Ferruginibacter sp.]
MKKLFLLLLLAVNTITFAQTKSKHPAWIMQGNIYEVNIRQYTNEGTFNAFAKHLPRLKNMGVQTLWFMPINPISVTDRKGTLGSYYAVSDYTTVNPEFGTLADWKKLVSKIHAMGMKVIIDWVPNHSGADHRWLNTNPDFYVRDSTGKAISPFDWTDVRKLNYDNRQLQDSMISTMKYWIQKTDIDGYRCDVAGDVPESFWRRCIRDLNRTKKNIFMLAESDKDFLHRSGFDATYPWEMFQMMKKVAAGERPAFALDSVWNHYNKIYPADGLFLYFTSNHDENSWNKSDFATFPGAIHAPFAVFTQTTDRSIPLIYSGQEEPVLRSIQFFEKDPMGFKNYKRAAFYKTLLDLRKRNPALSGDASFEKLNLGNRNALYAYTRQKDSSKVLVLLNLSAKSQSINIGNNLAGNVYNVFKRKAETLPAGKKTIPAWGYEVYEYKK